MDWANTGMHYVSINTFLSRSWRHPLSHNSSKFGSYCLETWLTPRTVAALPTLSPNPLLVVAYHGPVLEDMRISPISSLCHFTSYYDLWLFHREEKHAPRFLWFSWVSQSWLSAFLWELGLTELGETSQPLIRFSYPRSSFKIPACSHWSLSVHSLTIGEVLMEWIHSWTMDGGDKSGWESHLLGIICQGTPILMNHDGLWQY